MQQSNINEAFLLELLKTTDVVYDGGVDEHFYFYPKDFGFTVEIPYSQYSTRVDINFIFESSAYSEKKIANFSFASPDDIKDFMKELYSKNEKNQSYYQYSDEAMDKVLEVLQTSVDKNYPFKIEGTESEMKIVCKENGAELTIFLGRAIYKFENLKSIRPLEPITMECLYRAKDANKNEYFKKVIPAYKAEEYPIVAKLANINKTTDNVYQLIDCLQSINPEASSFLSATLLNLELDKKDSTLSKRNKI